MPLLNNRRLRHVVATLLCWIHFVGAVRGVAPDGAVAEGAGLPSAGFAIETFQTDDGLLKTPSMG